MKRSTRVKLFLLGALAIAAVAAIVLGFVRFEAHRKHVDQLTRSRDDAQSVFSATSKTKKSLDDAWASYDTKLRSVIAAFTTDKDQNGLVGFVAVAHERINTQLGDSTMVSLLSYVSGAVAQDGRFQSARRDFLSAYESAQGQLTSFSAILNMLLNNPFLAAGMGDEGRNAAYRLATSETRLESNWAPLSDAVDKVDIKAGFMAGEAQRSLDAEQNTSVLQALLNP